MHGRWGSLQLRPTPAAVVVDAARACCELLLRAWPRGGRACDDFVPEADDRECSFREQDEFHGWWPLHLALQTRAPDAVLDVLRPHTPCDAFGNPKRRCPGRTHATKSNASDMRRIKRAEMRSEQLHYLCDGCEGAPQQLQWMDDMSYDRETYSEWPTRSLVALQPSETRDPSLEFEPYDDWLDEEDPVYSDDED